jgi:hypothetical protein
MAIVPNHFPEVLTEHPPDPYDVAEPASREDWPESDPRWDERWGLVFADDVPPDVDVSADTSTPPLLDLRDFVVTAADLKALKAPPPDADVLLVPQEGGA